jgi:hypothetical protein
MITILSALTLFAAAWLRKSTAAAKAEPLAQRRAAP